VLVSIEGRLSLLLFGFLPLLFLISLGFRRLARKVTRAGMRAMANVNSTIKETVSGIAVAKNFRQEASVFKDFDHANRQSYQVNVQRGLVLSMVFPMLNAMGGVATGILVYVGGLSVAQGIVSAGAWFLFLQSLDRFFFPVLNLSAFWAQVQSGLSASERVFALIDAEPQVMQVSHHPVSILRGEIKFDHVWFEYSPKEPVLCDFDLKISPGETVALVGHTGAGKSSIAKLIARFYEFQKGKIFIDGQDSLMRVLVRRPSIFILDEATASIDPFTEWQIQQALNLILENSTSILIAHRLSTVKAADRIIVLEDGKIIEQGNHHSLLQEKGHYATLYNTYFRHQSLSYVEEARNLASNVQKNGN
jgi:ABC-type multidrug transport system fused ATPase/permease subunit